MLRYAILLYFDHRLGRIVRHLYNPNLVFFNKKPNIDLVKDGKISLFRFDEKDLYDNSSYQYKLLPSNPYLYKYKSNLRKIKPTIEINKQDMRHYPNDITMCTKYLCDGKITRHMFNIFLSELIRDYFFTVQLVNKNGNVYNETDITSIRFGTNPTIIENDIGLKTELNYYTNLDILDVKPFIDYPSSHNGSKDLVKEIYIPKGLTVDVNI